MKPWEKYGPPPEAAPWANYGSAAPPIPKPQGGDPLPLEGQQAHIDNAFHYVDRIINALLPPDALSGGSVQDRAKATFGFDDLSERGSLLPLGRNQEGGLEFAMPQAGVDMATSALLPSHIARGGQATPDDVTRFALDFAAPAGRSIARLGRKRLSRKEFVEAAPSTEELKTTAVARKGAATSSGLNVDPDKYADFLAGLETSAVKSKVNPTLHPQSTGLLQVLAKELGNSPDVEDLHILRRVMNSAEKSNLPDDRRIAGILRERLDDFVEAMTDADTVSGGSAGVAENLRAFRLNWSRAMKSDTVERIVELAQTQASGFENGIRIGFRQLVRNPKRLRGFSKAEIAMMKRIASGGNIGDKLLRLGAKAGFGKPGGGSNFLGGAIGAAGGQAAGGPAGMVAVPAIGGMLGEMSARGAGSEAALLRAMTATGQEPPKFSRLKALADLLAQTTPGPLVGTQLPTQPTPLIYKGKPVI